MDAGDAGDVQKARRGDTDAFRALVERHGRHVFRLAYRMTGSEHDAEDVVQETFLKAYRRLGQFEERAHFGTWLHRIAANCAYDLLRRRARREEAPAPGNEFEADPLRAVPSEDPGPERLAMSAQVARRVRAAMARLTALERSAFSLRHFEGLSIREVADALGLDEGAAKQGVFRAVRKLREALEPLVAP